MEELCSIEALTAEGKAMNHCVAGYVRRCKQGTSAIFSLRRRQTDAEGNTESRSWATLEVHPQRGKIVQIRAYGNRPVNNNCMILIRAWATANDLTV